MDNSPQLKKNSFIFDKISFFSLAGGSELIRKQDPKRERRARIERRDNGRRGRGGGGRAHGQRALGDAWKLGDEEEAMLVT